MSIKKTKTMVISRQTEKHKDNITLDNLPVEQVDGLNI